MKDAKVKEEAHNISSRKFQKSGIIPYSASTLFLEIDPHFVVIYLQLLSKHHQYGNTFQASSIF